MEVPGGRQNKWVVCLYEILGTALLFIGINWGAEGSYGAEVIATTVFICIIICGPVSGAHLNPAVTIGVLFTSVTETDKKVSFLSDTIFALIMIVSEILGGFIGCLIARFGVYKKDLPGGKYEYVGGVAKLCPGFTTTSALTCNPEDKQFELFMVEMIMTFLFVSIILNIKRINGSNEIIINGASVSLALYGFIKMIGNITGACLNPAVALVQTYYQTHMYQELTTNSMMLYFLATITGGLLASTWSLINFYVFKNLCIGQTLNDYRAQSCLNCQPFVQDQYKKYKQLNNMNDEKANMLDEDSIDQIDLSDNVSNNSRNQPAKVSHQQLGDVFMNAMNKTKQQNPQSQSILQITSKTQSMPQVTQQKEFKKVRGNDYVDPMVLANSKPNPIQNRRRSNQPTYKSKGIFDKEDQEKGKGFGINESTDF